MCRKFRRIWFARRFGEFSQRNGEVPKKMLSKMLQGREVAEVFISLLPGVFRNLLPRYAATEDTEYNNVGLHRE